MNTQLEHRAKAFDKLVDTTVQTGSTDSDKISQACIASVGSISKFPSSTVVKAPTSPDLTYSSDPAGGLLLNRVDAIPKHEVSSGRKKFARKDPEITGPMNHFKWDQQLSWRKHRFRSEASPALKPAEPTPCAQSAKSRQILFGKSSRKGEAIISTAANLHMFAERLRFVSYEPLRILVKVSASSVMFSSGIGIARVQERSTGVYHFEHALHVPNLLYDFISYDKLFTGDLGIFPLGKMRFVVGHQEDTPVLNGRVENGLFLIEFDAVKKEA